VAADGTSKLAQFVRGTRWDGHSPPWARWVRTALLALAVGWAIGLLAGALKPLEWPAAEKVTRVFQLTWDVALRDEVLAFWRATPGMRLIAVTMLLLDALLLVPLYVRFLWLLTHCVRRTREIRLLAEPPPAPPSKRVVIAGWAVIGAAVCDEVENLLSIALVLTSGSSAPAGVPLAAAAWLKWTLLAVWAMVWLTLALGIVLRTGLKAHRDRLLAYARGFVDLVGVLCLYAFPLASLALGIVLAGFVPQTQEVLTSLVESEVDRSANQLAGWNLFWLGASALIWSVAVWFAMRMVSRWTPLDAVTRAPRYPWVRWDAPRVLSYFGLITVATLCALQMAERSSFGMAAFMSLGAVIMFDAVSIVLTRLVTAMTLYKPGYRSELPAYGLWVLVSAAVSLVVGWLAMGPETAPTLSHVGWSRSDDGHWSFDAMAIEPESTIVSALFAATALVYGLILFRRSNTTQMRLTLCALGVAFWFVGANFADAERSVWVFGIVLFLAACGLWFIIERRHFDWKRISMLQSAAAAVTDFVGWTGRPDRALGWSLVVGAGAIVILFSTDPLLGLPFGTLGVGFAALAMWSVLLAWVFVYLPKGRSLGNWSLVPLVWIILLGQQADHSLRPSRLVDKDASPTAYAAPTVQAHFAQWRQELVKPSDGPVFLIAASGGGLRAAYWTATLLAAMDDRTCGQFGNHVFAVSGVSGGSLGLAAYLAQRKVWGAREDADTCPTGRAAEMRYFLRRDFLGPVAGSLLFAEGVQAFVPFTYLRQERGNTLSDAWAQAWQATFDGDNGKLLQRPFREVFAVGPGFGSGPAIFLNSAGVETGRRVIASNVELGSMLADPLFVSEAAGGARPQSDRLSVVDAVLNSARFPGISPAGRVWACEDVTGPDGNKRCERNSQDRPWGHLVDGGYFENSGLETLMDTRRQLGGAGLPPMFLIIISNDSENSNECKGVTPRYPLYEQEAQAPRKRPDIANPNVEDRNSNGGLDRPRSTVADGSDWTAPLTTLMNVREGRSQLESRRAVDVFGCTHTLEWSLAAALRGDPSSRSPPLGWLLSQRSVGLMDAGVDVYAAAFPFDAAWCTAKDRPTRGLIRRRSDPVKAFCPSSSDRIRAEPPTSSR
jgi:hypothetical protein